MGRGRALGGLAPQPEADDLRDEHGDRLAELRGLGLDSADSPSQHAESVDHRRVRVSTNECIGVSLRVVREDYAGEVFQVDLMHYSGVGWHHFETGECFLRPAQQRVALAVALELEVAVDLERARGPKLIPDHRMVDDELGV